MSNYICIVSTGNSRNSSTVLIIAIVAPISVGVLLFFVGCFLLRRRARKNKDKATEGEDGKKKILF